MPNGAEKGKSNIFLKILTSLVRILIILGVLFYVLYHLTNGFSPDTKTETVRLYTEKILVNAEGVIVREEIPVNGDFDGVVSYRYKNGERVKKGAKLAVIYGEGADSEKVARLASLDELIDNLTEATAGGEAHVFDGIFASKDIQSILLDISDSLGKGELHLAAESKNALLKDYSRKNKLLSDKDVSDRLAALEEEREQLALSLTVGENSVYAKETGYFYDTPAKAVFDYDSIKSLTVSQYNKATEQTAPEQGSIGKLVVLPKWYVVFPAEKEEALPFKVGSSYEVNFSKSDISLSMKLEAKNEEGSQVLLAFSSSIMPEGFDFSLTQRLSIVSEAVEGFRLPSSALRVVDGVVGVYIRSGNKIKFRTAEIIYEKDGYSLIKKDTEGVTLFALDEDESNDIYCKGLSLYDDVIISGAKELSPDRIVN